MGTDTDRGCYAKVRTKGEIRTEVMKAEPSQHTNPRNVLYHWHKYSRVNSAAKRQVEAAQQNLFLP